MTPLEITLLILVLTIVAFITGKIPFSVISAGIMLSLIMTGVMDLRRHSVDLSTQMWSCLWQYLSLEQDLRKQV